MSHLVVLLLNSSYIANFRHFLLPFFLFYSPAKEEPKIDINHTKNEVNIKEGTLVYLKNFNKRYPSEVKLLGNNPLTKRLKILMKDRYVFLKNTWAVETPIEIKNNIFIAWGCQQHNCSNTNFLIVVDFTKNVVYVGLIEEEKVKIYSEDGSSNIEITKWANRTN